MKVVNITPVGKKKVYDISVADVEHYILENGVVTHNTGIMLSADNVWIIGRSQEKDGTELLGYNFNVNIEKSRWVREKTKISITVKFDGGVSKWSGLLDMALESGDVIKPSNGWYSKVNKETGEIEAKKYRLVDTDTSDFWLPILKSKSFSEWVEANYKVTTSALITDEEVDNGDDNE